MTAGKRFQQRAFTLIEVLIAVAMLAFIVVLLSGLLAAVNRTWVSGEQRVENYQNGRAILDLIARDLRCAVMSPKLQFIQNPSLGSVEQPPWNQRRNSAALFWQSASKSGASGNICEVGYYLDKTYRLQRFFVQPDDPSYNIFASSPSASGAPWVTNFDPTANPTLFSVVSDGVIGIWLRCIDRNGDPIPWYQPGGILYNSAATFQSAPEPSPSPAFKYTNSSSTAQAHLLPFSVEITIETLDKKTLSRPGITIPGMPNDPTDPSSPAVSGQVDIPTAIQYFEQKLISNGINSARKFSTRVRLANASEY